MQLSHGVSVDQIRGTLMRLVAHNLILAGALAIASPAAAGSWAHLRVYEGDGSRVSLNLPVSALRAAAGFLRTDREARMEISGTFIRLGEISTAWSALRNQPPGTSVVYTDDDRRVSITRETSGLTITAVEGWSGEQTTISIQQRLADALSGNGGQVRFDAVAAALATTNGAPLKIRSSDSTTIEMWVDGSPEGVTP